jgi:pSer/pThr/pTyr-binding forkhead associated (FHA) protein
MRLFFPGGEHAPVELGEGTTRIGSDAECEVLLDEPGIAARHCLVTLIAASAIATPLDTAAPTFLNGRQIDAETPVKPGDLLVLARVGCSILASEQRRAPVQMRPPPDNDGRTRVRQALPRFALRGVSGTTFGKHFAVTDNALIGRQPDCDIPVPAEEISRQHARFKIVPEGLLVTDLDSANGTFINDTRIQSGMLKPGDELRLDTVRFILVAPGMDARQQAVRQSHVTTSAEPTVATSAVRRSPAPLVVIGVIALAAIAFVVLRHYGML